MDSVPLYPVDEYRNILLKFNERETLYLIHFRNPNPASTKLVTSVNGRENFSFLIDDIRGTKSLYGIM